MITKRAVTGAALTTAAVLWLAAPAAADGLPRVVFCDDFTSVDPAQVSFCIEDAQGVVLGGGVSPTADELPTVVAAPDAPGGWGLTFPEGWAGTAVMDAPALVATPPPAATPAATRAGAGPRDDGSPRSVALGSRDRVDPGGGTNADRKPRRRGSPVGRGIDRRSGGRRTRGEPGGSGHRLAGIRRGLVARRRCAVGCCGGGRPRPAEAQDQRQRR